MYWIIRKNNLPLQNTNFKLPTIFFKSIKIGQDVALYINIFLRRFWLLLLIFRINLFYHFNFVFLYSLWEKWHLKTATLCALKNVFCIFLWPNKEVWVFALKSLPSSSLFSLEDVPVVQEHYHNGALFFLILNVLFNYNFHILYAITVAISSSKDPQNATSEFFWPHREYVKSLSF